MQKEMVFRKCFPEARSGKKKGGPVKLRPTLFSVRDILSGTQIGNEEVDEVADLRLCSTVDDPVSAIGDGAAAIDLGAQSEELADGLVNLAFGHLFLDGIQVATEERELVQTIEGAIQQLGVPEALLVTAFWLEGVPVRTLAVLLKVSDSAVYKRVDRALDQVRSRLGLGPRKRPGWSGATGRDGAPIVA